MRRNYSLILGFLTIVSGLATYSSTARAQSLAGGSSSLHTLGINADGTVAAWGENFFGELDVPGSVTGATAVSAGQQHSLALLSDGTVVAWGSVPGSMPGSLSVAGSATAVSAGEFHSLALRSDGTVAAWGSPTQVTGAGSIEDATAISAGRQHSLALLSDGTVAAWGTDNAGSVTGAASVTGATAISAGGLHSLALRSDGTVAAWGFNGSGQVAGATGITDATAVSAGDLHSLALRSNGTVAAWGFDGPDQIVTGAASVSDAVYAVAGSGHNYAVLRDGSITSWGRNNETQQDTPGGFALPTSVRWTAATSADYLTSHLWDGRIPSTALSTATFDQAGTYTVGFNNSANAAGLNIDAGNVTFDLGAHEYIVGGDVSIASGATFTTTGTVTASTMANDGIFNANGNVSTLSTLTNSGTLNIADTSTVTADTINNSSLISIASGGQLTANTIGGVSGSIVNDGTLTGKIAIGNGGTLSGTGTIVGNLLIANGATLAPGNSVGLMDGVNSTWGSAGKFNFDVNDATGTFGGDPDGNGWDALQLTGTLDITASSGDPFLINISSLNLANMAGPADNFDPFQDYSWTFVTADVDITNFDASKFQLDRSGFLNTEGGNFSVAQDGNSLNLNFTAVPEPSSIALLGLLGAGLAAKYRRRLKREKGCEANN